METISRNSPCPCGSGKKYKHCCLPRQAGQPLAGATSVAELLQSALALQKAGQLPKARQLYRQVLSLSPDHPDALHLLGLLARQEGDNAQAAKLIRQAVKLHPNPVMYCNLGNAYQSLEEFPLAIENYERALEFNPDYLAALNNLANVYESLSQPEQSFPLYQRALALNPHNAELYNNLGNAARQNKLFNEARPLLEQAISLSPTSAKAHMNLGKLFAETGKMDAAFESLKTAKGLDTKDTAIDFALASVYYSIGRFKEMAKHLADALTLDPDNHEAWALQAFVRKMTPTDEPWAKKAMKLARSAKNTANQMILETALGKYFDDVQDYPKAFHYFSAANRKRIALHGAFDRQAFQNSIDRIIATSRTLPSATGNDSDRPVFIVGMPRSGTSLMEQIIASHPQAHGAGELSFFGWEVESAPIDSAVWKTAEHLQAVAEAYLAELQQHSATALRVVDKMPGNFLYVGLIHAVFPNARIIHMRRNPADNCLSIFFQGFSEQHAYANDLEDLAFYHREYQRLMAHWRETLPADRFLEVPYEALVEDQEGWSRKVLDFIGLDWDERCLSFYQTERRVGTASNWQVRQKIYKTSKARWKNYEPFIAPLLTLINTDGTYN